MHESSPPPPELHYHRYKLQHLHLAALHFFTQSKSVVPIYKSFPRLILSGYFQHPLRSFPRPFYIRVFPQNLV